MPPLNQLRDRIPSLYRPEEGDTGLLSRYLQAVAIALEQMNLEASDVLQSHWLDYADRALYSPYVMRSRQLRGLPFPGPSHLLARSDLINAAGLVTQLQNAVDPLSHFLREQFSPGMRQQVEAWSPSSPVSEALKTALVSELNRLLQGHSLYTPERFADVPLSEETRRLAEQTSGTGATRLNRRLLDEAYPDTIAESLPDSTSIHDLAYLATLLPLPPWQEPRPLRETIEVYRQRIRRTIDLYRNGLGTLDALRRVVATRLPVNLFAPVGQQDHPFWLEEFPPLVQQIQPIQMPGVPVDLVGPLMRWTVTNEGMAAISPTLYIQGVEPQPDLIDATQNPIIELYKQRETVARLGIAYEGTIAPGQTLRLQPAYASWIVTDSGLQRSDLNLTDPTAPGPWFPVAESPSARAVAFHQSSDRTLWMINNTEGTGTLWRYDGQTWTETLSDLPELHCLAEVEQVLLIGTETGLEAMPLYPEDGSFVASPLSALNGSPVFAIHRTTDDQWWVGTNTGAIKLEIGADITSASIQTSALQGTPIYTIHQDKIGTLYFGGERGLFQHQPGRDHWYWYSGESRSEQIPDWKRLESSLPPPDQVFLPPVRQIYRGSDTSLWLGTDQGIARYIARPVNGLTYETVLEAFPDLTTGKVVAIQEDDRGILWFATDRGLLRYDGKDLWQFQTEATANWVRLGQADTLQRDVPESRGAWQFQRSSTQWQRFDDRSNDWVTVAIPLQTQAEAAVYNVYWTDQVVADLGTWDGATFTSEAAIATTQLRLRYKPDEQRILDGGIAAIPRLPVGISTWRYLSLEPESLTLPPERPLWTIEGRLVPPPDRTAPPPGRYDSETPPPASNFDEAVFAFNPAARVWMSWTPRQACTVLVRLKQSPGTDFTEPIILERVWQGMQQVRPAGIFTALAVEDTIVIPTDSGF